MFSTEKSKLFEPTKSYWWAFLYKNMTFYKTTTYSTSIQEIEIERKTESTIWFKKSNGKVVSERIKSTYDNGFDTKQEAVDYLIELRKERILTLEQQIKQQKTEIKQIKLKYAE